MPAPLSASVPSADIENYYVRKQVRQLVSDHAQMNREKKIDGRQLYLIRQGVKSEGEMIEMIDKEMAAAKTKTKSWKQLDTYLKWNAISSYLSEKNVNAAAFEKYKKALQVGKLTDIQYDAKRQVVVCLNYKQL